MTKPRMLALGIGTAGAACALAGWHAAGWGRWLWAWTALACFLVTGAYLHDEIATDQGAEARALGDLEIRMFGYDRDVVFDSLTALATTPEPAIPDSVLDAQNQVAAAQQAWRDTEARWNVLRDTLQTLTEELDQLSRGQAQYRVLFRDFQDLDDEYVRVERQRNAAFENFTSLQAASVVAAEETRLIREQWA